MFEITINNFTFTIDIFSIAIHTIIICASCYCMNLLSFLKSIKFIFILSLSISSFESVVVRLLYILASFNASS